MIDLPDDPLGYELGPVPELVRPTPPRLAGPPVVVPTQPRRRWRLVLLGVYPLALALVYYGYETSDGARARRLARLHRDRASAWHQTAVSARRLGRIDVAAACDDCARNHAWFADAYRGVMVDRPRWHARPAVGEQPIP